MNRIRTCKGSLRDAMLVKPTISEKKIETDSKDSGCTVCPNFSFDATCLERVTTAKLHSSGKAKLHSVMVK